MDQRSHWLRWSRGVAVRQGSGASTGAAELDRLLDRAEAASHNWRLREAKQLAIAAAVVARGRSFPVAARPVALARATLTLATVHLKLGELSTAEALSRQALKAFDVPTDGSIGEQRLRLRILCSLGSALRARGRYGDAEETLRDALRLAKRRLGSEDPAVIELANELAVLYKYMARFEEAEMLYRQALQVVEFRGGSDLEAATLWHNLGGLEHARGRYARAEPAARRAVELRTGALGSDHPSVAADAAALAAILDALGRAGEAEALFRRAIDTFSRLLGPHHYEVAINANNLAALSFRKGAHAEAQALWEQALAIKRELFGQSHPEIATTIVNLGVLAAARGEVDRAHSLFEQAVQMLGTDVGVEHQTYRAATENLSKLVSPTSSNSP